MEYPPSTVTSEPVMNFAASEARKATTPAILSTLPTRGRIRVTRNLSIDRAHVDDRGAGGIGAARLGQERGHGLRPDEHAFHIHPHRQLEVFDRRVKKNAA